MSVVEELALNGGVDDFSTVGGGEAEHHTYAQVHIAYSWGAWGRALIPSVFFSEIVI